MVVESKWCLQQLRKFFALGSWLHLVSYGNWLFRVNVTSFSHVFRCLEENPHNCLTNIALEGGDSDSDGYLAEVLFRHNET